MGAYTAILEYRNVFFMGILIDHSKSYGVFIVGGKKKNLPCTDVLPEKGITFP